VRATGPAAPRLSTPLGTRVQRTGPRSYARAVHPSLRAVLLLLAVSGCSALVSPDPSRLGHADSGRAPIDAFAPIGTDADLRAPDAGAPDAAMSPACVEGAARCEGSVRVACQGGLEVRTDCAMSGLRCEAGACLRCSPGSVACSRDGAGLLTCAADGASARFTPCPGGCDATTNACAPPDPCRDLSAIGLGDSERVNLCDAPGATSYARSDSCSAMSDAESNDATFSLTLEEPTTVEIDLRDIDPEVAVDTIVYVRRMCDAADSQITCDDDIPCSESDIRDGCSRGVQVRQSRIRARLEAGTYFIVVDALVYGDFDCGEVELRVDAL
jgi:hypothetical protein